MRGNRLILGVLLGLTAWMGLALAAGPAWAQAGIRSDEWVVLTGRVDVAADETVGTVVIFDGPVVVDGTVEGAVVAFNGRVTISGTVTEDVVVFNGQTVVNADARIDGDLITQETAEVAEGATIGGDVRRVESAFATGQFSFLAKFAVWLAVSVSTFVLGVILIAFAPRAADAVAEAATGRFGSSAGWGAVLTFGLPIAAVILLLTVVGIPFGVGLLLALALIYALGYIAASFILGRVLVKPPRSRYLAFLAGWAILRMVGLVPVLGGITWLVGMIVGLGALVVAARRAGRTPKPAGTEAPPPAPPPPPVPPVPASTE